jgi:26S proteasome regulatory subunit N5
LISIVTIAKDAKDWSLLNEQVQLLSKKHGQLKQAITKMVQVVMGFLDDTPSLETKLNTIETLRTVTEGKVSRIVHHCSSHRTDHDLYRSSSKLSEHASRRFFRISSGKRAM